MLISFVNSINFYETNKAETQPQKLNQTKKFAHGDQKNKEFFVDLNSRKE